MTDKSIQAERNSGYVYWWLFWSPLITVPWMIAAITPLAFGSSNQAFWSIAVLSSALPHLVLLLGLRSKYVYVRRHVQQALVLAAIRTLSTLLLVGALKGEAVCLWIPINGALWLWGSIRGLRQVKRGECWLMEYSEVDQVPRPWSKVAEPQPRPVGPAEPSAAAEPQVALEWQTLFVRGRYLEQQGQRTEAVECYRTLFLSQAPIARREAVAALEKLGEVERF